MTGSEHNDEFYMDKDGRIRTKTNRSGGIQVINIILRDKSDFPFIVSNMSLFMIQYPFSGWNIKWRNHQHENRLQANIDNLRMFFLSLLVP